MAFVTEKEIRMRSSTQKIQIKVGLRLLMAAAFLCAVSALSGHAISAAGSTPLVMSIAVTNNSSREIRHVYLSPVDRKEWGPDQMDGTVLKTGQTFTIIDVSCQSNEIKIVAEDQDGCFMYGVVSCAEASTSWVITDDTVRDCGD